MGEALREYKSKKASAVYVFAGARGHPLYIGSSKNLVGFYGRYQGNEGAIDAALDGSDKSIFVAKVNSSDAKAIETQLIYEEGPKYNKRGKTNVPKRNLKILHEGDMPHFKTNPPETTI